MEISCIFTGQVSFAIIAVFYNLQSYKKAQLKPQIPIESDNSEG